MTHSQLQVLQKAVCPEKRIGIDSAVSALASVTEVEVSSDLAVAKVYLSVFSDDRGKSIAISGLKRLEGYVRKHIATSMNLRMAPEIRFLQDDTIARAEHVSVFSKHACVANNMHAATVYLCCTKYTPLHCIRHQVYCTQPAYTVFAFKQKIAFHMISGRLPHPA